jgi:hypothetical protein
MTPQELADRLWQFAARIAKVVDALPDLGQVRRDRQIRQKTRASRGIGQTSSDDQ